MQSHKLQPHEVYFLDIGANIGIYTLSIAAHGFQVVAFEPMVTNQQVLQLSLCANPGVTQCVTLVKKVGKNRLV